MTDVTAVIKHAEKRFETKLGEPDKKLDLLILKEDINIILLELNNLHEENRSLKN